MELGKIEVVVVSVQELVRVFFVHTGATKPDTAVASLDGSLSHVEVTELKVVIELFRLVFGGIVGLELDLWLIIKSPWRLKLIFSLYFSLDKRLVHIVHVSHFSTVNLRFLIRVREPECLYLQRVRSLDSDLFLSLLLVLVYLELLRGVL